MDHNNDWNRCTFDEFHKELANIEMASRTTRSSQLELLFDFIHRNFDKLNNIDNLTKLLAILHQVLQLGADLPTENVLNTRMLQLIREHKDDQAALTIAVQILYQILKTNNNKASTRSPSDASTELVELVFAGELNKVLTSNIFVCLQLYASQFNDKALIEHLWNRISKLKIVEQNIPDAPVHMLVHLIDEFILFDNQFHTNPILTDIIQMLLVAQEPLKRKSAYYLLRKCVTVGTLERSNGELASAQTQKSRWVTYITILENLEENQSHLVLPSLAALRHIPYQTADPMWPIWMNILYGKILGHTNTLIKQWAIEYFLEKFTCADFGRAGRELLHQILDALNNTRLYNYEGYFLVLPANVSHFLTGDLTILLEEMANINWKVVPLHYWLGQLHLHSDPSIDSVRPQLLVKLAARVRDLKNVELRSDAIRLFGNIFRSTIETMDFTNYATLVEALHNIIDPYTQFELFVQKASVSPVYEERILTQRLYEILTNTSAPATYDVNRRGELIDWNDVQRKDWHRTYVQSATVDPYARVEFCLFLYGIDLMALGSNPTHAQVVDEFRSGFERRGINNKSFAFTTAMEYFVVRHLNDYEGRGRFELSANDLMRTASPIVYYKLTTFLSTSVQLSPEQLHEYVEGLKSAMTNHKNNPWLQKSVFNFLTYCEKVLPEAAQCLMYKEAVYNIDPTDQTIASTVLRMEENLRWKYYENALHLDDGKTGDSRIEKIYRMQILRTVDTFFGLRESYACDVEYPLEIVKKLLQYNNAMSIKKPRYFENSKEHRQKLRIIRAVYHTVRQKDYTSEDMWSAALEQNSQLNVTYIYELLMGRVVANIDAILAELKMLSKYTASQQMSLISIVHCYCVLNPHCLNGAQLQEIVYILLPLTMGANFQVRLLTQLAMHRILTQSDLSARLPNAEILVAAIETAVGDRISKLLDIRLELPTLFRSEESDFLNIIAYITNTPLDEYRSNADYTRYDHLRSAFKQRHTLVKQELPTVQSPAAVDLSNFQRKMNPTKELLQQNTLISYPDCVADREMFVVASLIDKLPNLGGIARTCEVLGIKNLVLDTRAHIQKDEFKKLSMSAEKMLNIIEVKPAGLIDFLVEKQLNGFKVVGAEQTVNSKSFIGFEFPKKCILLLGHEKEGLPPHLLGFLDYAVEIPQFGMVRSLNVHVTGALFMWEYCKQHIVKQ